jgi:threonine/homoserine/homoserine lactone efflux protein
METMMFEVSWALFIIASLLLIITPGQDMVLVMSRSVAQGSAAGLATAAGVGVGLIFAALTFLVKAPVGYFAGLLSVWLRARPNVLLWIYRSSGLVLIALAIKLTFERRN